jgi:hypothetical protein
VRAKYKKQTNKQKKKTAKNVRFPRYGARFFFFLSFFVARKKTPNFHRVTPQNKPRKIFLKPYFTSKNQKHSKECPGKTAILRKNLSKQ